jgi:hypothetical protein
LCLGQDKPFLGELKPFFIGRFPGKDYQMVMGIFDETLCLFGIMGFGDNRVVYRGLNHGSDYAPHAG